MATSFDIKSIRGKLLDNKKSKKLALSFAEEKVLEEKNKFLRTFESHPVTQEINGGASAANISRTLGGYGNLFSFIGFESSSSPIMPVLDLIKRITIVRASLNVNSRGYYVLNVKLPSIDSFGNVTKMPWESGRSWLLDIEKTISGVGAYLYGKFSTSRSGAGIQSKYNYSSTSFRGVEYFRKMYNEFLRSLNRK